MEVRKEKKTKNKEQRRGKKKNGGPLLDVCGKLGESECISKFFGEKQEEEEDFLIGSFLPIKKKNSTRILRNKNKKYLPKRVRSVLCGAQVLIENRPLVAVKIGLLFWFHPKRKKFTVIENLFGMSRTCTGSTRKKQFDLRPQISFAWL